MPEILSSLMDRWGGWIVRQRALVTSACLLLALAAIPGALNALRHLDADISNQVSDELVRFRTLRELNSDFGGDILAAVVFIPDELAAQPKARKALCAFGELLTRELGGIKALPGAADEGLPPGAWLQQVECRAGENFKAALEAIVKEHPQAVLEEDDVKQLKDLFEPKALAERLKQVRQEYRALDPAFSAQRRKLLADPLNMSGLAEKALQRRLNAHRKSMGLANEEGYFLSGDGSTLIVLARPVRSGQDLTFCRALMAACQQAENRALQKFRQTEDAGVLTTSLKGERYGRLASGENANPQLHVGYTGMHAIAVENEASMRWDVLTTTATSAVAVLLVFLIAFHSLRLAWQIAMTMGLAVLLTLAVASLVNGKIGVLGAGFPCILLGMGVDYGIHLHGTFHAMCKLGKDPPEATRIALSRCGPSILAASLTTVVAFGGIATTHFRGLAELGLLSCIGLVFAMLLMLTLFPALLLRSARPEVGPESRRDVALRVILALIGAGIGLQLGDVTDHGREALTWGAVGLGCGAVVAFILGRIQVLRRTLLPGIVCAAAGFFFGGWPGAMVGAGLGTMASAVHNCVGGLAGLFQLRAFRGIGFLCGIVLLLVMGVTVYYSPEMGTGEERMLGVRFDAELGNIRSLRVLAIPLRQRVTERFGQGFNDIRVLVEAPDEDLAFAAAEKICDQLKPELKRGELSLGGGLLQMIPSVRRQEQTLATLQSVDLQACRDRFMDAATTEFGGRAAAAFRTFLDGFDDLTQRVADAKQLSLAEILDGPIGPLAATFARIDRVDNQPRVRLVSYYRPKPDCREEWFAQLADNIESAPLAGTAVRVTAAQMVGFELKDSLILSMRWISSAVLLLVVVSMLIAFRSVPRALLAALPLLFAYLFVLGGVAGAHHADLDFALNYVNLMIFPILLGSSIDYGIYLVFDATSPRAPEVGEVLRDTGRSVLLCGLTTLAGFGSMVWGSNTGLISFGWTAICGYLGALIGALLFLPAILAWRRSRLR